MIDEQPKRRGRPPKAKAIQEAPSVSSVSSSVSSVSTPAAIVSTMVDDSAQRAQAYALRVWDGQGVDVSRNEKLRRVARALEAQGLSMEGVVL